MVWLDKVVLIYLYAVCGISQRLHSTRHCRCSQVFLYRGLAGPDQTVEYRFMIPASHTKEAQKLRDSWRSGQKPQWKNSPNHLLTSICVYMFPVLIITTIII